MRVHRFKDEDLRILATLAIDLSIDNFYCEIFRQTIPEENYWEIDVRFAVSKNEINSCYDSLHIDCGRDNEPETYQMCWTSKDGEQFKVRPICSPLVVVHQFEEMCKSEKALMN